MAILPEPEWVCCANSGCHKGLFRVTRRNGEVGLLAWCRDCHVEVWYSFAELAKLVPGEIVGSLDKGSELWREY